MFRLNDLSSVYEIYRFRNGFDCIVQAALWYTYMNHVTFVFGEVVLQHRPKDWFWGVHFSDIDVPNLFP